MPTPRAAWDTVAPGRRGQPALVAVGSVVAFPGLVLTLMRLFPPVDDAGALVASFIPSAVPLLGLGLVWLVVGLVRARRRLLLGGLVGVVVALLAAQLAWQLPYYVPDDVPVAPPTFTLLSLNTFKGEADPDQVVAAAARADVVVLVEMTPALVEVLDQRGWRERFPFDAGVSGGTLSNTAVFSRWPLSDSARVAGGSFDQWLTTVAVPTLGPLRLLAVHPCNPYCGQNRWSAEHRDLLRVSERNRALPLVVAGDFNAVPDHGPLQDLGRTGLRNAVELVGAGWSPTYPANRLVPPLLAIDHVLLDPRLGATALERVPVAGTDHLGLLARVGRAG